MSILDFLREYIVLVTGVVVFTLTTLFNQWKERKNNIKLNDAYFRIRGTTRRIKNIPFRGEKDSKQTLLINDIYEELSDKENPDLYLRFVTIENTSDNGIFNITIKQTFKTTSEDWESRVYYQDFMSPKERFYLTVAGEEDKQNLKFEGKFKKIYYETSAGVRYLIRDGRLFNSISPFRLKFRIFLGFIPILQSVRKRSTESFTKARSLNINVVKTN